MRWFQTAFAFMLGFLVAVAWMATPSDVDAASAETISHVLSSVETPHRKSPSGKARIALLGQGKNAFLGKLHLAAGAKGPTHRDATEEYIHVLKGSGTVFLDGRPHPVSPGSTIVMAANAEVRFENGPAEMVGIQVFAGPSPAAKYGTWLED